jgi:hypothetical protein
MALRLSHPMPGLGPALRADFACMNLGLRAISSHPERRHRVSACHD